MTLLNLVLAKDNRRPECYALSKCGDFCHILMLVILTRIIKLATVGWRSRG